LAHKQGKSTVFEILATRIFPYFAIAVFIFGTGWRIRHWIKGEKPKLTLFPVVSSRFQAVAEIGKEVVIFKSLLKSNRKLWIGTWIFHAGIAVILVGHTRLVADWLASWTAGADPSEGFASFLDVISKGIGVIVVLAALFLLARRIFLKKVSEISSWEDYFMVTLLLAIAATGDALRFFGHVNQSEIREYVRGLIAIRPVPAPENPVFILHFFLAQVLLVVAPFSKFMHIPGIFFSKILVMRQ